MADELQTDLIVRAIAEGFEKLSSEMDKPGSAAERTTKKISNMDKAMRAANKAVNGMKTAMGGAKIALAIVEQAFTFAAAEAEKLGRVDVVTNIEEAKNALSGLGDVLVQIPIGGRDFLQWMGDGAAGLANFAKMVGALSIQAQLTFGIIDRETAILQINALVTDEAAVAAANLEEEKKAVTEASKLQVDAEKRLQDVMKNTSGYKASQEAAQDAEASLFDLRSEIQRLRAEQGKAVYSAQELEDIQLDLAEAQQNVKETSRSLWEAEHNLIDAQEGLVDGLEDAENAYERARISNERAHNRLEELTRAYDEAKRATIDNSQAISELNDRLREAADEFYKAKEAALEYAEALGRVNEAERIRQELGLPSSLVIGGPERRQHGGAFRAGGAYFINESAVTRPEVVQVERGGGGQVLTRQQAAGNAGNTLSIGNVNLNNGMDLAAFKAMLRQSYSG